MPVIKSSCVRDLKVRVNLADVVSRVVTLRKAGGNRLKGLCPFHQEKTPSFHVDADKGFYKCFGCGKAGDVITFIRDTEQLSFTEAVEALGKRFGIAIEYEEGSGGLTREERSLRQELFDLHEQAAEHFHEGFRVSGAVGDFFRSYWVEKRRFAPELAEEFKIGAVDESGSGLGPLLLRMKFSEEALRKCGLFFVREDMPLTLGALRPRFRGRLMIPIRDHQGRVVAFTARQTDLTPEDDPAHDAKYVNSPETPIFTKGNLLFNLDRARSAIGEGKPFVLVEGQLDALRCWSVGLKTAIAPQGTSITENQLVLLRRYHPQVECFFDSDAAGQKAALRFLPMALKAGLEVRFLAAAAGAKVDPDVLFLERGFAAYEELHRQSLPGVQLLCKHLIPDPKQASVEEKTRALAQMQEIIDHASSVVTIGEYNRQLSDYLGISNDARVADLARDRARRSRSPEAARANDPERQGMIKVDAGLGTSPEHHLLLLILHNESLGLPLSQAIQHDWVDVSHVAGVLLNRFLGEFEHHSWTGRDHLDVLLETEEERALVAALLFETPAFDDPAKIAQEGLRQLRARSIEPRLRQIELALANADADSKFDPISLLKERSDLQRQLRQPLVLAAST